MSDWKTSSSRHVTVNMTDFIIINIPAWLFALLVPAAIVLALAVVDSPVFLMRLAPIPLFVWGVSGMLLLLADYRSRKRALFLRLSSRELPAKGSALYRSLCGTPCGLSLLLAAGLAHKRVHHSRASAGVLIQPVIAEH